MAFLNRIFRNRDIVRPRRRGDLVESIRRARGGQEPLPIPQVPSPLEQVFKRIQNQQLPVLLEQQGPLPVQPVTPPPVSPMDLPPQLPRIISGPDPDAPSRQISRDAQGNMILGDIIEPIKIPNLIGFDKPPSIGGAGGTDFEDKRSITKIPLVPPPLEDFGFGPGIRRSEDFFIPEDKMMGKVNLRPPRNPPELLTETFVPPPQPPRVPLSERTDIFGAGKKYDPANLPEGFSFDKPSEGIYTTVMPPSGFVYAYGPDGERVEVPSGNTSGIAPVMDPIIESVVTPEPVIKPAPTTPSAVASNVGAVPVTTIPQDVRGQVDPVLAQQDTQEILTDPLLRALYFGTADQPGFINQLQQATANLIGSDVPLQQTAGLSELEQIAQDRALADLGVAEPFVGESADLIRGTTRQFDPSMTQQFFNPFEDQVVQQTIQDVLEAGEKRDIQQRARDIQTGGLSAFGSRARLAAADRQEALGRGLAEALSGIRQAGFGQAQRDALTTFAQQRQAEQQAARDIGQVGSTLADLRARERSGLAGFGQTGRGIEETGLSRLFQQQLDQQGRPLQALQLTGQLLPQFQAGRTQIDSQYRLPADPTALGLGAAFSAYTSLKPPGTT